MSCRRGYRVLLCTVCSSFITVFRLWKIGKMVDQEDSRYSLESVRSISLVYCTIGQMRKKEYTSSYTKVDMNNPVTRRYFETVC